MSRVVLAASLALMVSSNVLAAEREVTMLCTFPGQPRIVVVNVPNEGPVLEVGEKSLGQLRISTVGTGVPGFVHQVEAEGRSWMLVAPTRYVGDTARLVIGKAGQDEAKPLYRRLGTCRNGDGSAINPPISAARCVTRHVHMEEGGATLYVLKTFYLPGDKQLFLVRFQKKNRLFEEGGRELPLNSPLARRAYATAAGAVEPYLSIKVSENSLWVSDGCRTEGSRKGAKLR